MKTKEWQQVRGLKKVIIDANGESQIEILTAIFLKDVYCARDVRLAGWLG